MVESASSRPQPSATGTFAKTPFAHVLLSGFDRKLSGTLEVRAPAGESATIVLSHGRPSRVRTTEPVAYLGRILLEQGTFSEPQLAQALRTGAEHQWPIGQVLATSGLLEREHIEPALLEQLARRLRYVARLPADTEYSYFEGLDALAGHGPPSPVAIDPYPTVWSSIRETPSWDHALAALARVGAAGLRLSANADLSRFGMSRGELATVELLRGQLRGVDEVTHMGVVDPDHARLVLYGLVITKQVELVADGQPRPSIPARSPLSRAPERYSGPPASQPTATSSVVPDAPPPGAAAGPLSERLVLGKEQLDMQKELIDAAPAFEASETGEQRYREAQAYLKAGDLRKAETAAKVAAECRFDNPEYLALYGWIAGKVAETKLDEARGRVAMELAIEKLDKALRLDPGFARAYMYRGVLKDRLGQEEEGMLDLKKSLELSPRDTETLAEIKAIETRNAQRAADQAEAGKGWRKLFR